MRQTKTHSIVETILNTASGFIINLILGQIIFPIMDISVSLGQNIAVVCFFTVVSILRSYIWRRIFDHINFRKYTRQANVLSAQ